MTDSATAIAVAPILDALLPLIAAGVSTAVAGVIGIAVSAYNSSRGRASTVDAANEKIIADAAGNEAAKIVAGAITSEFGEAKIDLNSPMIKAAAANILGADAANLKKALVATGATPDRLASLVLGAVGAAQIKIVGGASTAATPVA